MGERRWAALIVAAVVAVGVAWWGSGDGGHRERGAAGDRAGEEAEPGAGGRDAGGGGRSAPTDEPGGAAGDPAAGSPEGAAGTATGGGGAGGAGAAGDGGTGGVSPATPRAPGWRPIAAAPLAGRHAHSAVWTGREMIVWGGATRAGNAPVYFDDGAAYDPAGNRWRRLPESPLSERADHVAAWTGREMLVWGGHPGTETPYGPNEFVDGAAYDPGTDRWRPLPEFPLGPRYGARAVWTGRQLVVWGGSRSEEGEDPSRLSDGAAYDPAADRWTRLPPSPLPGRVAALAAPVDDGDVLFSWGLGAGNREEVGSARYDTTDRTWQALAPAPADGSPWCFDLAGCIGVDTGSQVVFAGEGLAYDQAADGWSVIAPSPFADPFRDGKAVAWTGNQVFLWGGGDYEAEQDAPPSRVAEGPAGAAYDPQADRWEPVDGAPIPPRARTRAVWTGAEVIVWGGESAHDKRAQYADGAAWTPPR